MFQPLECFIGLRYLRSRRRRGVVSFMSAASLLSIALGVASLIVILSVMNGFETELRTRLLSMNAHLTVFDSQSGLDDGWPALQARLEGEPDVAGVAPYVMLEGMLAAGSNLRPAAVRGVDPALEGAVSQVGRFMEVGSLDALQSGARRIVLGRLLALNLGVDIGQRVNVLVPRFDNGRPRPQLASFEVVGIFEAGILDNDANLALVHIHDASLLKGFAGRPEGLAVRLEDAMLAPEFQGRISPDAGAQHEYSNWTEQHRSIFRAIRIEKIMMTVILMFIVAVAAFNIVASLMMVVTDKERDIAILRTCGIEPDRVARIFFVQGSVLGFVGAAFGTMLGLVLAANVGTIVPWLESTFNFQIMPGDLYYVTAIPSEIHARQVVWIPIMAFGFAVLATWFPSRRAARVAPAQALRYD
jgi:lipoprotein-releasing system permease protein